MVRDADHHLLGNTLRPCLRSYRGKILGPCHMHLVREQDLISAYPSKCLVNGPLVIASHFGKSGFCDYIPFILNAILIRNYWNGKHIGFYYLMFMR